MDAIFTRISGTCPSDVRLVLLQNLLHQDFYIAAGTSRSWVYNRGSNCRDFPGCVQWECIHSPSG
jgi:hypothetical protein